MKIKCPGCATVLQAPDSAAGKVIQCQCGKQLRLPAPSPTAGSAPASSAAATRPAPPPGSAPAKRPAPAVGPAAAARPTAPRPQASANPFGLDAGAFDDLTADDMRPIRGVGMPAVSASPAAKPNPYSPASSVEGSAPASTGRPPGTLIFLGVVNGIWTLIYLLGVLVMFGLTAVAVDFLAQDLEAGAMWGLLLFMAIFASCTSLAVCVACFVPKTHCWYIVVFAYAFFFADRIMGVVGLFQEEMDARSAGRAVGSVVVGLMFWAYLHGEEVRAFYRISNEKLKTAIIPDALGLLVGFGLGAVAVFAV